LALKPEWHSTPLNNEDSSMDEHIDLYDELTADFENPLPLPTPIPDPIPLPRPIPFPLLLRASGLYESVSPRVPAPTPGGPPIIFPRVNRELRLDVDGNYPQMTVSGTESSVFFATVQWIAKLAETESDTWEGDIYYKDGGTFAYTHVKVEVTRSLVISEQKAKVTLSGGSSSDRVLNYKFKSRFFHAVEFEFDCTSDSSVISSIETHAHPNRPASLPNETLTIEKVFQRAGFQVTNPGEIASFPLLEPEPMPAGATQKCTMPCRHTGRASITVRSGRCGRSSQRCTKKAAVWVASCLMKLDRITAKVQPFSTMPLFRCLRLAMRLRMRGCSGCASGRLATKWGTASIWHTPGKNRRELPGFRLPTNRKSAAL
jgi:hypothetical protein